MRKLAFVVGGVAAGGVAALLTLGKPGSTAQQAPSKADSTWASLLTASDTGSLKGPRQPIFFRHDIHAGQYRIQCQYCHYSVAVSPEPGIPSVQTCMGCHLVISGRDSTHQAEIKKVRQAWNDKKPIQWVRVHYLRGGRGRGLLRVPVGGGAARRVERDRLQDDDRAHARATDVGAVGGCSDRPAAQATVRGRPPAGMRVVLQIQLVCAG